MTRFLTTTALVMALTTPAAFATDDAMKDTNQSAQSADQSQMSEAMEITASDLIDRQIYRGAKDAEFSAGVLTDGVPENWDRVGHINDVLITEDGDVSAMIVDAGGWLGMNQNQKRIGADMVEFVRDTEGKVFVIYTGDPGLFEEQSSYDETAEENQNLTRFTEGLEGRDYMTSREDAVKPVSWSDVTTEDLLGIAVYGSQNEWVGDLSELNVSQDGTIESAIIDVGGFLGIGEKRITMDLDSVTLRRAEGDNLRAYVSATEEELEAMDAWDGSES
ncbi:MAG: PRC-barrel domain-containing protein [Pseudomonadota bacterium]